MSGFSRVIVAIAALLVLSMAVPSASAMVLGGHSPITMLLTAPDGQFGCTSSGCSCPAVSPCTATSAGNDFVNSLPSGECSPYCVYFVDSGADVTYIGIPNPTPGTWTVTYFGTLGSGQSGAFTITAGTCGFGEPVYPGTGPDNYESLGTCGIFCDISSSSSVHVLCDSDDSPDTVITVTSGTVTGSSSGSAKFCVTPDGVPCLIPPLGVPQFSYGFIVLVAVTLVGLLFVRRNRTGT